MKTMLVIGESCKDVFIYCEVIRLAPDIPVPVLNVIKSTENPGMASNVFRNIAKYIKDCEIKTNFGWETVEKIRYIHENSNHHFFRVDSNHSINKIDLSKLNLDYQYIIISDYNKGFLSEHDIQSICESHSNVFLDTKKIVGKWAEKAKFIKINDFEYNSSKPYLNPLLEDKIIHTKGEYGCVFQGKTYSVRKREVRDTSGAGDSFMAALVVKYFETQNIIESIEYANDRASRVVETRGVGCI
jgi:D-beta-D-heptose 7-phosphate kinase/D-beta-D-heptose 1-phosphate adenosyltransferase